jgi:hypothetical protein
MLLWLAIALLPLRGLANAWLVTSAPVSATAAAVVMPCHASPAGDTADSSAGCAMCDLCHACSAVAPVPRTVSVASRISEAPVAALPRPHGRVGPDGIFRPPRSALLA